MIIKIMNKLYPGKENYNKRNAVYRKIKSIIEWIDFVFLSLIVLATPFVILWLIAFITTLLIFY